MRALIDTVAFLAWMLEPEKLSRRAVAIAADPDNDIVLSAASAWELSTKAKVGRIELALAVGEFLAQAIAVHGLSVLPMTVAHAVRAGALAPHHKDPFDRMLVAQAEIENMPIVTPDPQIRKYGVATIW
ncbi:MAG: type II toxin-antitoxin system VapC family toxin [Pseudomonadota bacterium]